MSIKFKVTIRGYDPKCLIFKHRKRTAFDAKMKDNKVIIDQTVHLLEDISSRQLEAFRVLSFVTDELEHPTV